MTQDYELARISRVCRQFDEVHAERDRRIRDAHARGKTIRAIAEASGLSVSRIGQLVQGPRSRAS